MTEVRVPATSANMGAGFDTMGIALGIYNNISVCETENGLKIYNRNTSEYIPTNENNLIYKAVMRVFDEVGYSARGLRIVQDSSIPMTRGLGSSSACIVGGLLSANAISGHKLPYEKLLELAVEMEGHPDNVVPAFYGGFCVSLRDGQKTHFKSFKISPHLKYAVMVPDFYVQTRKSRELLPESVPMQDAAHNISRAVWFATNMITGNFDKLAVGVDDRIHQPYRKESVDGMDEIFEKSYELGSKATFLSGSGPTIVSVLDDRYYDFSREMNCFFENRQNKWRCTIVGIDNVGAVVKTVNFNDKSQMI